MSSPASAAVPSPEGEGASAAAGAGAGRRVGESVFAALVIGIGVFALIGAFTIRIPTGNRLGPTVFPILVGALLILTGAVLLIGVLRGRVGVAEESEDIDPSVGTDWKTVAKLVALLVAHLFLIEPLGWVPAATVLFGGVAWVLGARRWWLAFLVGAALSLVVQVVFGQLLGLSLPLGPLLGWLGLLVN